MLQGTLELHDIRDVEAFCTAIVKRARLNLTPHEQEDLTAYLIEEAWILSTRYKPGGLKFSTWAGTTLRLRIIDNTRNINGRTVWQFKDSTYERQPPQLVSIDDTDNPSLMGNLVATLNTSPNGTRESDRGRLPEPRRNRSRTRPTQNLGTRKHPTNPAGSLHHLHRLGDAA